MENSTFDIKKEVLDDAIDIINPSKILGEELPQFNFDIPTQGKIVENVNKFINQQISTEDFISSMQDLVTDEEKLDKLMNIVTEKITNPMWDIIETHSIIGDELMPNIEDFEDQEMGDSDHQALAEAGIEIEGFAPKDPERKYGEEIFKNEELDIHEKMLSKELEKIKDSPLEESPAITSKESVEVVIEPQNFIEQKFTDITRNTTESRDQTVPSITKQDIKTFDPYREKI
jgi:hypothetical protein